MNARGPQVDAFLGTETRMHPTAYSMSYGGTLGFVEVGTVDSLDLIHTVRIRSASCTRPMSVTSVFGGREVVST